MNQDNFTATYSPEDNKLRIYADYRLDAETYARFREVGFKWAPKQELFVAPKWPPAREDFCLEFGVCSGRGQDSTKLGVYRFGHLYSPVSRICAHPGVSETAVSRDTPSL